MIRSLFAMAFGIAVSVASADDLARAAEIFQSLDTPKDLPVPFVERRSNPLLSEPMELKGEVIFTGDGELIKVIHEPVHESVTISAKQIQVEREGSVRNISIGNRRGAKEFYQGLRALLDGELETIAELFLIDVVDRKNGWAIQLVPKNPQLQEFLMQMEVDGKNEKITRIRTVQSDQDWQELRFDTEWRE